MRAFNVGLLLASVVVVASIAAVDFDSVPDERPVRIYDRLVALNLVGVREWTHCHFESSEMDFRNVYNAGWIFSGESGRRDQQ
jgi:hypothetical protein